MAHGGARNRSGPPADPNSETSERRGLTYKLLPAGGFTGRVPAFPLPAATARERAVWKQLWRTPQASMWNVEKWRIYTVGQYCRWSVRAEDVDAAAAVLTQCHRLGDQLGLTPAGLKENGWRISTDELGAKRTPTKPSAAKTVKEEPKSAPVRRLRAVSA